MRTAVNIRGTGGSGKSTLVRRVMELYASKAPVYRDGRRQPIYYQLTGGRNNLLVPGHYETACGGCDTIKTVDEVYALIDSTSSDVLYEGIIAQDDVTRAVAFSKRVGVDGGSLVVIRLNTPIEVCLDRIRGRRAEAAKAKGKDPEPLNEKNTRGRYESQLRICSRLKDAGVSVEALSCEDAFVRVRELLGV